MQNILNRNLINPDIGFVEFGQGKPKDRDYIFSRINKIKQLLVKNGVQRGDFVHVYVMSPNVDAVSSFIAIAELGCLTHCVDNAVWHHKDSDGKELVVCTLRIENKHYTTWCIHLCHQRDQSSVYPIC